MPDSSKHFGLDEGSKPAVAPEWGFRARRYCQSLAQPFFLPSLRPTCPPIESILRVSWSTSCNCAIMPLFPPSRTARASNSTRLRHVGIVQRLSATTAGTIYHIVVRQRFASARSSNGGKHMSGKTIAHGEGVKTQSRKETNFIYVQPCASHGVRQCHNGGHHKREFNT